MFCVNQAAQLGFSFLGPIKAKLRSSPAFQTRLPFLPHPFLMWDKRSASRPALLILFLLHRADKDAPTYLAETDATKGQRTGSNNILFSQRLGAEGNRSE